MIGQGYIGGSGLRIGGGIAAILSLGGGLLVLFIIPGASTYAIAFQLIILSVFFVVGVIIFFFGDALSRKLSRKKTR